MWRHPRSWVGLWKITLIPCLLGCFEWLHGSLQSCFFWKPLVTPCGGEASRAVGVELRGLLPCFDRTGFLGRISWDVFRCWGRICFQCRGFTHGSPDRETSLVGSGVCQQAAATQLRFLVRGGRQLVWNSAHADGFRMALPLAGASYIQHMCSVCDSVHILRYVYTLENKHGIRKRRFGRPSQMAVGSLRSSEPINIAMMQWKSCSNRN